MNATPQGRRIIIVTLLLLFVCAHGADAQKRLLFQGTVMGHDGKPMKDAHVEMWQHAWGNRWASTVEIAVAPNGSFMTKLYPGLYTIRFAGVDHAFSPHRYLYIDSAMNRTVHARLARSSFLPLAAIDTVFAVCVDPTGGRERIVQEMRDLGGGRYEASVTLPGRSTPLLRMLDEPPALMYHIAGIVPERRVNGTDQDYYRYDGGGDFFSVKRIEDTVVTLRFEYSALTAVDRDIDDEGFRFHIDGEPLRHPYAMLARRKQAYRDAGSGCLPPFADSGSAEWEYYIEQGVRPLSLSDTAGLFTDLKQRSQQQSDSASAYVAELREKGDDIGREEEESLLLLYMNAVNPFSLRKGRTTRNESVEESLQLLRRAMDRISPASPIWCEQSWLLRSFRAFGDEAFYAYCQSVMRENPAPVARYYAFDQLQDAMRHDTTEGSRERLEDIYREAQRLLKGTVAEDVIARKDPDPLTEARKQVEEMRRMRQSMLFPDEARPVDSSVVGKAVPPFRFMDFNDTTIVYTDETLRGSSYVLCINHVSDHEHVCLVDLLERYADRGLRVVMPAAVRYQKNPDDTAGTFIRSFERPDDDTRPWPLLLVEASERRQLEKALKAFKPGHFLVDPDGIVVASGYNMYEMHVEVTVDRYFEDKLE